MDSLTAQTAGGEAGVDILNGVFSSMTMREQVEMAQRSCVMVGAHGAGLSHILFSPPGVHMLELQPPAFRRPHFVSYSFWTGAHHHMWSLDSSSPDVHTVVARVLETARHAAVESRSGDHRKGDGAGEGAHPNRSLQCSTRPDPMSCATGFRSVPIPSMCTATTSPRLR
jgi:hypothetical protein